MANLQHQRGTGAGPRTRRSDTALGIFFIYSQFPRLLLAGRLGRAGEGPPLASLAPAKCWPSSPGAGPGQETTSWGP